MLFFDRCGYNQPQLKGRSDQFSGIPRVQLGQQGAAMGFDGIV